MALVQLVATGSENVGMRNLATQQLIPAENLISTLQWDSTKSFELLRLGDLVKKFYVNLKVGPAPTGYRWKRCWPFYFVKNLELNIGGQTLWKTNTSQLRMEHMIHGLKTSPDWLQQRPGTPLESLVTSPEKIFDYGDDERTQKSMEAHEICFEPLNLAELIKNNNYGILLICLAFNTVNVKLTSGSLIDCLEPIGDSNGNVNCPILKCEILNDYVFLDTNERRQMAQTHHEFRSTHMKYASEVFEPRERVVQTWIDAQHICSAAYLWITDENNNELPSQVVDRLEIRFNDEVRQELTGYQSRFVVRDNLPHPTLANNKSQNLYYISYYPGRVEENGAEQGANFSRLDAYKLSLILNSVNTQRIKLHMIHRVQNQLRILQGMAGLAHPTHDFSFLQNAPPRVIPPSHFVVQVPPQPPQPPVFENTDQLIDIQGDETACMITFRDFNEGDVVQQCLGCKKVFSSDALDTWFSHPNNVGSKKCVHCRQSYSVTTFRKGKAHIVQEQN